MKSRPARKTAKSKKSKLAKKTPNPNLAAIRPPPPGLGKRGEKGHLAYLLRQAQAATRLTLERTLADLKVTPPAIRGAHHAAGLSRAVRRRCRAGGAADAADRRRHHRQSGTRRRHQKSTAPRARPGAAVDTDPAAAKPCSTNAAVTSMRWSDAWSRASAPRRKPRSGAGWPGSPQSCSGKARFPDVFSGAILPRPSAGNARLGR